MSKLISNHVRGICLKGNPFVIMLSYIDENAIVVTEELVKYPNFLSYNIRIISPEEAYAANRIHVNDYVIVPKGFPKTTKQIKKAKFKTI